MSLTRFDYENYLIQMYFGPSDGTPDDYLRACIARAYLDFSRTLEGIASFDSKLRTDAKQVLVSAIAGIRDGEPTVDSQNAFDRWHEETCQSLISVYDRANYDRFSVGHAQKWMTLKYIYTMGKKRMPGYIGFYDFCHIPLDNIVLSHLRKERHPDIESLCPWSKLNDYGLYLNCQKWVRDRWNPPLDVEFSWWNEGYAVATEDV